MSTVVINAFALSCILVAAILLVAAIVGWLWRRATARPAPRALTEEELNAEVDALLKGTRQ
jgi:hypothetical protein